MRSSSSLILFLTGAACLAAQDALPKRYECRRISAPLRVDGKMDDTAWKNSPWTDWFVDIEGAKKPAPRFRTRMKMLWDDEFLYFGAEMEEPHVWGTLTQHDAVIFRDNDFEVFLDPTASGRAYFEFEMNALNTGWDLFLPKRYKEGGDADNSWEIPGLKTAVHIDGTLNDPTDTDRGWSVEIAIPFAAVRRQMPRDGEVWRVNFSRVEWQVRVKAGKYEKLPGLKEDNWVWSPQGEIDMHVPAKWGFLTFHQ